MIDDPVTTILLLLMIPGLVWAASAYYMTGGKTYITRRFTEKPGMSAGRVLGEIPFYKLLPSISILNHVLLADVSFWQAGIDFVKMKAEGIKGVVIRAGQNTWMDVRFVENWAKAKAAGLPRGSYWFYDSRTSPKQQAALWHSLIKADYGELCHVADFEENYGGDYGTKEHFKEFLTEFQRLSGLPDNRIVIYTGYYYWLSRVGNDPWFARFPLWLAWYADMGAVKVPAPWVEAQLILWQWTSSGDGLRYGVSSDEIDLNWWRGTEAEFNTYFGLVSEPPPPGGSVTYYISDGIINIRTGPGMNYSVTGKYVEPNDMVEASEVSSGWARIAKLTRNGMDVVLPPVAWCGTAYLRKVDPPPPPPPSAEQPPKKVEVTDKDGILWEATQFTKVI